MTMNATMHANVATSCGFFGGWLPLQTWEGRIRTRAHGAANIWIRTSACSDLHDCSSPMYAFEGASLS